MGIESQYLGEINIPEEQRAEYAQQALKLLRAGGMVTVLLAVVILYLAGVDQWICIPFGTVSGGLLAWAVFRLNARYGEHGLMKLLAEKRHPRYLIHRKRVFRLFAKRKKRQS